MTTLVIHHPEEQVVENQKKSFATCVSSGLGKGFAISKANVAKLRAGDCVVILCNTKGFERRAEGKLVKLEHTGATGSGLKRYCVHIEDIHLTKYHRNDFGKLNHNGVAVF
ncbi:hypothetical protein P3647_13610 [Vibrio parahaemolyticus]|uniref:hypothetical protein n=1 Tax=Vibrio parahaemolyticus TaxID=670 RepID=UPI001B82DE57|nr:hypothetical protein [Vibrio parahaemolyticus]MDF5206295.1 hypothetical protein [Vibrio parahaemolyticus]MDF5216215.1 hypothetical protein [Vibrio parahaemolyticus]HBC3415232.1 hypothetical protein [Vibrio parahaemolyticus]HBC3600605.1 hypothetical protein [Vibrio parahaemolyticus]HBC3877446.1 hypothetical protein [Vibrio parahaemolyticus]